MKNFRHVIITISVIISLTFLLNINSFAFNAHKALSAHYLQNVEESLGIETKDDSEVFKIEGDTKEFHFNYVSEAEHIDFFADRRVTLASTQENIQSLTEVNSGFCLNSTISADEQWEFNGLEVELPDKWSIEIARRSDGSVGNGSLGIYTDKGEPVAATGLPKIIDANGMEITAGFSVENNQIKVTKPEQTFHYPVTLSYGVYAINQARGVLDYFHYAGFNLVHDGSLTLGPRYFDETSTLACTEAWEAVCNLFYPYDPYWTNDTQTESMEDQYWCHANWALTKADWNLEPWRPIVSWWDMIVATCNPE